MNYPKRLIEVDLPIARISAHARREKSIRHGHISTLHIWWARRPLAACRAVICAALWPDPADPLCPQSFRERAIELLKAFSARAFPPKATEEEYVIKAAMSPEGRARWEAIAQGTLTLDATQPADLPILQLCLLDFIADFANWDNSTVAAYLETSRALTQAAHEALGGEPGTRPLVVDPFAGGGSIPLEALRVGADAFASDLNPIPVLLNKVVLEYIPKYGKRLADEVRKWGAWIKEQAEKELAEFYPKDSDGATPIAYLWARTIRCEGPDCGAEVPLMRSLWLAKRGLRSVAVKLLPDPSKRIIKIQIINDARESDVSGGTIKKGSVTCPCCGYTTPVASIRKQLNKRRGGTKDAKLYAVVTTRDTESGRFYRLPNNADEIAIAAVSRRISKYTNDITKTKIDGTEPRRVPIPIYGMNEWRDIFTDRQLLSILCFGLAVRKLKDSLPSDQLSEAVQTVLSLCASKISDRNSSLCRWIHQNQSPGYTFGRQAIPMLWDFVESNPFASGGGWNGIIDDTIKMITVQSCVINLGQAENCSADKHLLPDDSAHLIFTDPPYYYSIPYANLADFFYVWLKKFVPNCHSPLFVNDLTPKDSEIIQNLPHKEVSHLQKDRRFYEERMSAALSESRRVARPEAICTIVFAHTETEAWEAMLNAVIASGWCITASWPIDTERESRMISQRQSSLASSVHLVCRPRENANGSMVESIGDWRDVLQELPKRIHEWMPRLAAEGVVGADAIFACLGPALEVFSRYSRVENAKGDAVPLKDYLEHVWAAVSTEALTMIFRDADAAGLEPDARLTAMWLWTLGGGKAQSNGSTSSAEEAGDDSDDEESSATTAKSGGYTLEFDAARKIAQGLGVHLEKSDSIVEVKGETARLLPVAERTQYLFGQNTTAGETKTKGKKKPQQKSLFGDLEEAEAAEAGWTELKGPPPGSTALDRLHQAMILFAAGRGELMKRFLVDDGVGQDARFWKLAQSLSALYPSGTDEKRWVDGVLARKKGLGL